MSTRRHFGFALTVAIVLAACAPARAPGPLTIADLTTKEQKAAKRVAEAECACGNEGSLDRCVADKTLPAAVELDLHGCDTEVDSDAVTACVKELRTEGCAARTYRANACAHDLLCP
ncbi:MAG TPA: hypothetical protein VF407_08015, partial [Polyangiaceae bacterium]